MSANTFFKHPTPARLLQILLLILLLETFLQSGAHYLLQLPFITEHPYLQTILVHSTGILFYTLFLIPLFYLWKTNPALYKTYNPFPKRPPFLHLMGLVLGTYLSYIVLMIPFVVAKEMYNIPIPGLDGQEALPAVYSETFLGFQLLLLLVIFIGPVVEELFFRGLLLPVFHKRFPKWYLGSILSALIFASIHFTFSSIIPLFILGLLLNSLRLYTNNMIYPIMFHILNNALTFFVLFTLPS